MTARLRVLGGTDLGDGQGRPVTSILRQPKRLVLLTYLALEGGDRFLRRDSLIGLFWPDLDQEHARAALRRALHFLRRGLGEAAVEVRGNEELRLAPGAIHCDATECRRLLDAGRDAEALAAAAGDLLPGVYVAGAPGVEQWLDTERSRLRRRLQEAAWRLATTDVDPTRRAAWVERAVGFAPEDPGHLTRALELLEPLGRADLALQLYQEHLRCLRDLDLAPEPRLAALAGALRRTPDTAPAATPPRLLAVLPFALHGSPELGWLREGMVDLLATALDGIGGVRTLDPTSLLAAITDVPAAERAAHVTRRFNAQWVVSGAIVVAPGSVRLQAQVSGADGTVVARAEEEGGAESGVLESVDALARGLLAGWRDGPAGRLGQLAARTTTSTPALRAWLSGEHALRHGRALDAGAAFAEAVEADASFALAYYRQASAAAASALIAPAREASRLAMRHRERLGERDRLLVEAQEAWLTGHLPEAERRYAAAVSGWPEDADAWFLLGDLLFHGNVYRGRPSAEARPALERALALDPGRVSAIGKLARIAALERREADLAALVERGLTQSPDQDQALALRALRAFALDDTTEQHEVTALLAGARALTIGIAFSDAAVYGRSLPHAMRLGRTLAGVARSDELRALVHLILAHLAAAARDLETTRAELAAAEELDQPWALEVRGLLTALPFLPWPDQDVRATRQRLAAWDPAEAAPNVSLPLAFHNGLHPHLRAYVGGLLAARLGDVSGVALAREDLLELPEEEEHEELPARLERSLEALRLELVGDGEGALALLAGGRRQPWFQLAVASPFFAGTFERWRRARLLARRDGPAAVRWQGCIAERSPWELPFRAAPQPGSVVM